MYEFDMEESIIEAQTRDFLKFLATVDYSVSPPEIARTTHAKVKELIGVEDLYKYKKKLYNDKMLEKYASFKHTVQNSASPVHTAVSLAIGGNIIDFSPKTRKNIDEFIETILQTPAKIDDIDKMLQDLRNAESILYLTDNTGEIVMDRILIETLIETGLTGREKITVATRGFPIINDATLEDAGYVGLTNVVKVIGNGDSTPGTALQHCSEEFLRVYKNADVIISKGQGNFETLEHHKEKNRYFMLVAKCAVIAGKLGVDMGDFVCKNSL
jgi:hypothetical protein